MMAIGWTLLAVLVPLGFPPGDEAASDPCRALMDRISTRRIDAHLHRSLLGKLGVRPEDAGGFMAPELLYTEKMFPVAQDRREEWSIVMGESLFLLEPALHAEVLELCRRMRAEPPDRHSPLQRLFLQSELWTMFDSIYLDGSSALRPDDARRERWERMLDVLSGVILHVALTDEEVAGLPKATDARRAIFRTADGRDLAPVEFYTLESFPIHDVSHRFRKVSRFFYADPQRDFTRLPEADVHRLRERTLPLSAGAIALLQEDLIAITRNGTLRPTEVPSVLKWYRILDRPENGDPADYRLTLLDPWSASGDLASALVPYEGEAWSYINLPNIPGHGQPAFRAPLGTTCAGCHGTFPNAFRPRIRKPLATRYFQFTRDPQVSTPQRAAQFKSLSLEFVELLRRYRRGVAADGSETDGPRRGGDIRSFWAGAGAGAAALLLAFWVRRRLKRAATSPLDGMKP